MVVVAVLNVLSGVAKGSHSGLEADQSDEELSS